MVSVESTEVDNAIEHVQAWETERPASSINWSIENAPVDMSSWSSAAALLAESVWEKISIGKCFKSSRD